MVLLPLERLTSQQELSTVSGEEEGGRGEVEKVGRWRRGCTRVKSQWQVTATAAVKKKRRRWRVGRTSSLLCSTEPAFFFLLLFL